MKAFFNSHAGKATAGVVIADLLIAWPDLLSWLVAGYVIYWSVGHLRQSFRSLDAEQAVSVRTETAPAVDVADMLDMATQLDMASHGDLLPVVIIHQDAVAPALVRGKRH